MRRVCSERQEMHQVGQKRSMACLWAIAAASALALGSPAFGQTMLYFQKGNTIWDAATTPDWTTTKTGGIPTVWVQPGQTQGVDDFNIANFEAAFNVNVSGTVDVGGINFDSGATNIGGTDPYGSYMLNAGSGNMVINQAVAVHEEIFAPIIGSGMITYNPTNTTGTDTLNLDDLTQYTGGITINASPSTAAPANFQLNSGLGSSSGIIQMQAGAAIGDNNQSTNNGVSTPLEFTLSNPILANYGGPSATPVDGGTVFIYGANGLGGTGTIGLANFSAGTQKVETYAGVISGPAGVTTNVTFGISATSGGRATVVLGAQSTYNGNTTVTLGSNNGLLQMGIDNALPATTILQFGSAGNSVAPVDLNGHNLAVAGLSTITTVNKDAIGNIYNTSPIGTSTPATITIAGAANTTYKGDIGDTNLNVNPFNDNYPYVTGSAAGGAQQLISANTNVSLVINGPGTLTLQPNPNLLSANPSNDGSNEYTGTTTINGGGLVFARTVSGLPSTVYTVSGNGEMDVNSGGTLSSVPTAFGSAPTFVGGTAGTIAVNNGGSLLPGGSGTTGVLSTGAIAFNAGGSMTFDLTNTGNFDQIIANGGLTLDSTAANHTIAIDLTPGGTLSAGTYNLIVGSTSGDSVNADQTSNSIILNTSSITGTLDKFQLLDTGSAIQLQVLAPVLEWDPFNSGTSGTVEEGGGTWTDGSTFYNYLNLVEENWNNTDLNAYDVRFGNDKTQAGGTVTLGENVIVGGKLKFGDVFPGQVSDQYYYTITDGGTGNTLTLMGGITVHTDGSTIDGAPSAVIAAPVVLGADQNWEVDSTDFLQVNGTLSGNHTLTVTGDPGGASTGGVVDLNGAGGQIGALDVATGGTVLLSAVDAIGNAPVTFDGGALELNTTATFSNPITVGASGGYIGAAQPAGGSVVLTLPQNITTTNTLTIIGSGTVNLTGTNSFGTLDFGGGTTNITALTQIGSKSNLSFSGGTLALSGISTLANAIIGTDPTASGIITDDVPLTISNIGTVAGGIAFSGSATTPFTLDIEAPTSIGSIAGASATTVIHKTGPGTLTLGGYTGAVSGVAGASLMVDQGNLVLSSATGLGGANSATASGTNLTMAPGTELIAAFILPNRYGGSITMNDNTEIIHPNAVGGESGFVANSAADVITFNGHVLIDNQNIETGTGTVSGIIGFINPIVVTSGSVLTLENENSGGYVDNDGIDFRGPTNLATNAFDTFTIQAGATVKQIGPGEVRFGRTNSQGIAIIGQGTPGADSVLQLTSDTYLMDTGGPIVTTLMVNGTGSAGLRIEAPMNASYVPNPTAQQAPGTTGLFGVINGSYAQAANRGSSYTVLSANRAMALSSSYSYNDVNGNPVTLTPSGTLTLAATDAGGATGIINAGPAAASAVALALDNTASSRGNLVYQINPASTDGGNFANFAGLTAERTYPTAATVTVQLLGTTKVPALTLTGGANLDIRNQALVVDPTDGSNPLAQIAGYLNSAYDHGKWDGTGIYSSVAQVNGASDLTSIGYALNSALPVQYTDFGGQSVDASAVLVKYTYLGDLNLDGKVDSSDLAMMGSGSGWSGGDLNYDGRVDGDDWALMMVGAGAYQASGVQMTSAVPEPSAVGLLLAGGAMLIRRRRRN